MRTVESWKIEFFAARPRIALTLRGEHVTTAFRENGKVEWEIVKVEKLEQGLVKNAIWKHEKIESKTDLLFEK